MYRFTSLIFSDFLAELTPVQRFEAARDLSSGLSANRWFLILAGIAVVILVVLFIFTSIYRRRYESRMSRNIFVDYAKKRGLSEEQRELLFNLADNAGFVRKEAIFNLPVEFEKFASRLITRTLSTEGTQKAIALRRELFEIRRKLGFNTYFTKSNNSLKSQQKSSRNIQEGKELYLTSLENPSIENIKSTLVENNEMELKVKPSALIDTSPGNRWRISYSSGAAIWEFDTTVFKIEAGLLAFDHSSEIRYINRRRFLRTEVNKPALIADFPFSRRIAKKLPADSQEGKNEESRESDKQYAVKPPDFVPAKVTELAGPGLRIETDVNVDIGQRILVVFELEKEHRKKTSQKRDDTEDDNILVQEVGVVEEVAEVRRKQTGSGRNMIAVELVGISDNILDDLVKVTNKAVVKGGLQTDKEKNRDSEEVSLGANS